jgi:hypothetical protein
MTHRFSTRRSGNDRDRYDFRDRDESSYRNASSEDRDEDNQRTWNDDYQGSSMQMQNQGWRGESDDRDRWASGESERYGGQGDFGRDPMQNRRAGYGLSSNQRNDFGHWDRDQPLQQYPQGQARGFRPSADYRGQGYGGMHGDSQGYGQQQYGYGASSRTGYDASEGQYGHRGYGGSLGGQYGQGEPYQQNQRNQANQQNQMGQYRQRGMGYGMGGAYGRSNYGFDNGRGDQGSFGQGSQGQYGQYGYDLGHFAPTALGGWSLRARGVLGGGGMNSMPQPRRSGKGPKGYKRSDERIREDVCDQLSQNDDVDPSELEVSVSGGEVTLTGTVPERRMKYMVEQIVDRVSGVNEIHNQLRVKSADMAQRESNASSSMQQGRDSAQQHQTTGNENGRRSGMRS